MTNFLTWAAWSRRALTSAMTGWISARAAGWAASWPDVVGQPLLSSPGDDLLGVEGDQHDRVRSPVAVHDRLGDPARLPQFVWAAEQRLRRRRAQTSSRCWKRRRPCSGAPSTPSLTGPRPDPPLPTSPIAGGPGRGAATSPG